MTQDNGNGPLSEDRRKEIFLALVDAQDQRWTWPSPADWSSAASRSARARSGRSSGRAWNASGPPCEKGDCPQPAGWGG